MRETFELKCPNCKLMLHATLQLEIAQGIDIDSSELPKETQQHAELLSRILEKEFKSSEFKEYCLKLGVSSLKEVFDEVLSTLTPREEKVIKMRFGLGSSNSEHTLEEVGKHFAITGGRVWQIENKALKKLRHPSRRRRLEKIDENNKDNDTDELDEFPLELSGFTSNNLSNEG